MLPSRGEPVAFGYTELLEEDKAPRAKSVQDDPCSSPASASRDERLVASRTLTVLDTSVVLATAVAVASSRGWGSIDDVPDFVMAATCIALVRVVANLLLASRHGGVALAAAAVALATFIAAAVVAQAKWNDGTMTKRASAASVLVWWSLASPLLHLYVAASRTRAGSTAPDAATRGRSAFRLSEEPLLATNRDDIVDDAVLARDDPSPEDLAAIWSRLTFWWAYPMLKAAYLHGRLAGTDLPALPQSDRAQLLLRKFALWAKARRAQRGGTRVAGNNANEAGAMLVALIVRIQPRVFFTCFGYGWLFLACMFTDPLVLNRLLDSADGDGDGDALRRNLFYVLILAFSMTIRVVAMEMCYFFSVRTTNNARTALIQAVYRKALRLSSLAQRSDASLGDGVLTNLMATDADKVGKVEWFGWFVASWTWAVVSLPPTVYFLWVLVGSAAFVGTAAMILGATLTRKLGRLTQPFVRRLLERRDARAAVLKELLASARATKLESWEGVWDGRLRAARELEMQELGYIRALDALNTFVGALVSLAIPASVFTYYTVALGRTLDSPTAFTALAWLTQMQWSVSTLPSIVNMWATLSPSMVRVAAFLAHSRQDDARADARADEGEDWADAGLADDASPAGCPLSSAPEPETVAGSETVGLSPSPAVVSLRQCSLGYHSDGPAVIAGVSLTVAVGELLLIVGEIGAGKSTLLCGLAGSLEPLAGTLVLDNRLSRAYAPQRPTLLTATVRQNVCFGRPFEAARFANAVRGAALEEDLAALAKRKDTVVGEAGVQLSGGQKARVALARCLYADADVYV